MKKFEVLWSMYGTAFVKAESRAEAEEIVSDGCMAWSGDIDWESNEVDGCDVEDAEEV